MVFQTCRIPLKDNGLYYHLTENVVEVKDHPPCLSEPETHYTTVRMVAESGKKYVFNERVNDGRATFLQILSEKMVSLFDSNRMPSTASGIPEGPTIGNAWEMASIAHQQVYEEAHAEFHKGDEVMMMRKYGAKAPEEQGPGEDLTKRGESAVLLPPIPVAENEESGEENTGE